MKAVTATLMTCLLFAAAAQAEEYKLSTADAPPEGLPAETAATLAEKGYRVAGPDGALCDVWLVKSPAIKDGFTPDFRVKYPFEVGTLVGVVQVGEAGEFTDFRDQVILPGVYTLRYGQQPQDGNHIGTSQQADFLLAVPADEDKSIAKLDDKDELNSLSADAAGSSHPAIFSLLPPGDDKPGQPKLTHQKDHDFWILQTTGGEKQPALRLVIVGFGEE